MRVHVRHVVILASFFYFQKQAVVQLLITNLRESLFITLLCLYLAPFLGDALRRIMGCT